VRLNAPLLDLVKELNHQLWQDTSPMQFVTAFFGRVNAEAGTIETISAGHGPNLVIRAGGRVEELEADAPPLGVLEDLLLDGVRTITLGPGDMLAIPTDGIFEAMDESGEMYGTDRMLNLLRKGSDQPLPELLEVLRADTELFRNDRPPQDDRTMLAIRRCV
jgi:sigma-B regulation protein RsbU (phosphoserine phosphatase)